MSTVFKDTAGRTWNVALNLGAARRVDKSDFSLLTKEPFSIINARKETFAQLLSNPSLAFAIIWAIVQPQAEKMYKRLLADFPDKPDNPRLGATFTSYEQYLVMSPEQQTRYFPFHPSVCSEEAELEFVTAIDGTTKDVGLEALWSSLADFFPDLATALSKMMEQYQRGKQKLSEKLLALEPEMMAAVDRKVEEGYQRMKAALTHDEKPGTIFSESSES